MFKVNILTKSFLLVACLFLVTFQAFGDKKAAILAFVDSSHSHWEYIQRDIDMLDSLNVSYDLLQPQDLISQTLSNYNLLIIPTVWAEHDWQTSERNNAILDFINSGGGLIVTEAGFAGLYTPNFFPYTITISAGSSARGDVSITDPTHPVVEDLTSNDFWNYTDSRITYKAPDWQQIVTVNGQDALVYCEYGSGFAIYTGFQIFQTGVVQIQWYVNAIYIALGIPTLPGHAAILAFVDSSHSHWGYIQRDIDMLDSLNVSYDLIQPQELTPQTLSNYKLFIIPTVWAEHSWQTSEGNSAIVDFINNGGGLIATEAGYSGSYTSAFFPYFITINAGWGFSGTVTITDQFNPIVEDLTPDDFGSYVDSRVTSKDLNWHQVVAVNGEDAIDYCEYGSGFAIYTGYGIQSGSDYSQWYVKAVSLALGTITSVISDINKHIPQNINLYQNYPNPFNPETTIKYNLTKDSHVMIQVYNNLGQKIRELENDFKSRGKHSIVWDGKNDFGERTASGVYFYQVQVGENLSTKKMIKLK